MATAVKKVQDVELPVELCDYIDQMVQAERFASASDVIRAALEAHRQDDAELERWLREDVAAAYDELEANPDSGVPADEVRRRIQDRYQQLKLEQQ